MKPEEIQDAMAVYNTEPPWEKIKRLEDRVAELEAALERIIAGPYAGQFSSAVEVAAEVLKPKP